MPEATDLPPLNDKNKDLLCPTITATAATTAAIPNSALKVTKFAANITGKAPFKASRSKTVKKYFVPKTLLTLVAPVEPEPICLKSSPVLSLTNK